jgi:hypothetical protein
MECVLQTWSVYCRHGVCIADICCKGVCVCSAVDVQQEDLRLEVKMIVKEAAGVSVDFFNVYMARLPHEGLWRQVAMQLAESHRWLEIYILGQIPNPPSFTILTMSWTGIDVSDLFIVASKNKDLENLWALTLLDILVTKRGATFQRDALPDGRHPLVACLQACVLTRGTSAVLCEY